MSLLEYIEAEDSSDQYLYHFTTYSSLIKILNSKMLHFSKLENMDDPFESTLGVIGGFFPEKDLEKQIYISRVRKETRLMSFCIDDMRNERKYMYPFNKGYSHSRMWDQYTNKHKGACLVFDRKELLSSLSKVSEIAANNVVYQDYIKTNYLNALGRTNDLLNDIYGKEAYDLFFLKTKDYENECECRIVIKDNKIEYINYESSLKAVIIRVDIGISKSKYTRIKNLIDKSEILGISWLLGEPSLFTI